MIVLRSSLVLAVQRIGGSQVILVRPWKLSFPTYISIQCNTEMVNKNSTGYNVLIRMLAAMNTQSYLKSFSVGSFNFEDVVDLAKNVKLSSVM